MMDDEATQYQELVRLYGTYDDQELLTLGHSIEDLTEMAQQVLKGELARRGLKVAEATALATEHGRNEEEMASLRAYAALAPSECVFEFGDEQGASAAYAALVDEGLDAVVLNPDQMSFDPRGPRVVVAPEDAARAGAVLSQPLLERFHHEENEGSVEFDVPSCPKCGGDETVLESADPVNRWRCDDCGHGWAEEISYPVQ
jgi:ribosomal protein S27AE